MLQLRPGGASGLPMMSATVKTAPNDVLRRVSTSIGLRTGACLALALAALPVATTGIPHRSLYRVCVSILMLFSDLLNTRFLVAAELLTLGQITRALGRMAYRRRGMRNVVDTASRARLV